MVSSANATWHRQINLFLLALGFLLPLSVSPVWAKCNITVFSGDSEALSEAIPLLGSLSITRSYGWDPSNTTESCCWTGIACQNISGIVRIVNLTFTGLDPSANGVLPPSVGKLLALNLLDLSNNVLKGPIPESWSGLASLTILQLSGNSKEDDESSGLNGTLNVLSNLANLKFVDVSANKFTGELHNLASRNWTSLVTLAVNGNQLTGQFPLWIKYLTKLEKLDISDNPLSASTLPTEASDWPLLTTFSATNANLIGPIPAILATLPLLVLQLKQNKLNGSIPPEFGNMNVIAANSWDAGWISSQQDGTLIDFSDNNLTGELPVEVGRGLFFNFIVGKNRLSSDITSFLKTLCTNRSAGMLQTLDMNNNSFSGEIPPEIGNVVNLQTLYLSGNLLTGSIPVEIVKLTGLANLGLDNNRLSGSLPSKLSDISGLSQLVVNNNNLTGELPDLPCEALAVISLNNNSFSGPLPSTLSKCSSLMNVNLQFNQFSGNISAFANQPILTNLSLANNKFSGSIPSNIVWPVLQILDLSSNSLSGSIPRTLGTKSPSILQVFLRANSFSGEIPSTLFSPQNLTVLDLSDNKFNASLSSSFLTSSSLTTVRIRRSGLFGPLPETTFKNSKSLMELDLQFNNLSGPLPSDLSGSSQLGKLFLSGNSFSGSLPSLLPMQALTQLNFSDNSISGSIPDLPPTLSIIDLSSNLFSGNVPSFGELSFLTYVDLSSNQLSGSIASNFSNSAKLSYLDFSQNNFTGTIPEIFNNLTSLGYFNVSNNFLTGQFPVNLGNISSYSNNSGLCGVSSLSPCITSTPTTPTSSTNEGGGGSKLSTGAIIGISVGGAVLALVILGALCFVLLTKSKKSKKQEDIEDSFEYSAPPEGSFATSAEGRFLIFQKLDFNLTVDDIVRTTENFNDKFLLGRGGFGSVYRATLSDDQVFAVKRLTQGSSQGDAEFQAEMLTLGKIRHRNLVTLIASYNDPTSKECLLVYNFLPGGNLDSLLKKGVEWPTRLNVAIGVARGLKYLHHDCIPYIIHRDMKPGNILMDSEMEAHVSDFGLAKVVDLKKTHVSTKLLGTIGYLAPEYAGKGQASTKSDVFAYGVVLLQLVSGKVPTQPQMRHGMSQWAKSTPVDDVIDTNLEARGEYRTEMLAVLKLGIACTARNPLDRPTMEEALHTLENLELFAAGVKDE